MSDLQTNDSPETDGDNTAGSSEVEKGRLAVMHRSGLTKIFSEATTIIISPRSQRHLRSDDNGLAGVLNLIKPVQLQLKDWFSELPTSLQMETVANMKLSSVSYVLLAYLAVGANIRRVIIRAASVDDPSEAGLARLCRKASMERLSNAYDFFGRLNASQLSPFWHLTSAECAAVIYYFGRDLEARIVDAEGHAAVAQLVKAYRWSCKLHSQSSINFAKRTMTTLQASSRSGSAWVAADCSP